MRNATIPRRTGARLFALFRVLLLGMLQPVDELLHLLEEHALALRRVRLTVPLDDRVFVEHIGCGREKSEVSFRIQIGSDSNASWQSTTISR